MVIDLYHMENVSRQLSGMNDTINVTVEGERLRK